MTATILIRAPARPVSYSIAYRRFFDAGLPADSHSPSEREIFLGYEEISHESIFEWRSGCGGRAYVSLVSSVDNSGRERNTPELRLVFYDDDVLEQFLWDFSL